MQQCMGLPGQRSGRVLIGELVEGRGLMRLMGMWGTGKGEIIWNVIREYRKLKKKHLKCHIQQISDRLESWYLPNIYRLNNACF